MKVNDLYPNWLTLNQGVFYKLNVYNVPWKNESQSLQSSLDLEYHGNVSGNKLVSPLVDKLIESTTGTIAEYGEWIAETIFDINSKRWVKLWATLNLNYNPIENYSMTETHTGTDTHTETPTNWTETETQTPNDWKTKETQTPNDWKTTTAGIAEDNNQNSNAGVYGFNSSESVPTSTTNTESNSKIDVESSGTYETETEQSGTYQTAKTQSGTFETETDYNTTLTRTGNIGTVTAQDMIMQERDIQMWNFFRDVVFPDIDKVLTLKVY